ncbi:MAG: hypothetical protein HDT13_12060 [Butyrivibrio sp.]|nr:hypothetical protein [Butyrivibrio sp.]
MENRNLEKALDIASALFMGETVGGRGSNAMLYEEYSHNPEVYDILMQILGKLDISLYEYNNSLFISPGSTNRVFGFSNEELKRIMGLRLNRELFLVYFIIYNIITGFYKDSAGSTYLEYLRIEDVIRSVGASLTGMIDYSAGIVMEEAESDSFKAIALLWDELPDVSADDRNEVRAARNSRSGYVKLTFNFLTEQKLFTESEERYYPTDRFRAVAENYFENNRGRLYEIMNSPKEEKPDAAD